MKKKNIIFRCITLTIAGCEKILIKILNKIDRSKYNISLVIDYDLGDRNVLLDDIPEGIDVYFLMNTKEIDNITKYSTMKRNILDKIFYNYYLYKKRKNTNIRLRKSLEKIIKKYGKINTFIDFNSGSSRKVIDKISANKKIVWMHNAIENMVPQKKILKYGLSLNKYDIIVNVCESMKDNMNLLFPFLKGKNITIYNLIDFNEIIKMSNDYSNVNDDELKKIRKDYVLMVGRVDRGNKDYTTLIEGYRKAVEKGFPYLLYIVGDGDIKDELTKKVKQLGMQDKIIFLGSKKNPYVWINNSKFFILSSRNEGFGLVLVEAMVLEKAVISSDCPIGPREILKNGKCGYLFQMENSEDLKNGIMKIWKDTKYKEEIIENGKMQLENYSIDVSLRKINRLLEE